MSVEQQLASTKAELEETKRKLEQAKAELVEIKKELDETKAKLHHTEGKLGAMKEQQQQTLDATLGAMKEQQQQVGGHLDKIIERGFDAQNLMHEMSPAQIQTLRKRRRSRVQALAVDQDQLQQNQTTQAQNAQPVVAFQVPPVPENPYVDHSNPGTSADSYAFGSQWINRFCLRCNEDKSNMTAFQYPPKFYNIKKETFHCQI